MNQTLIDKYNRKFKKATLMDDMKFRKICESKEAIEEILRVILKDNKLKVVEIIKQSSEDEPIFHGVILDCKCKLKTKEIVNIEVQVALDDNPVYRMRYNGSILTVENSPKSKYFKYKSIPKLILIMFCNFDLFKKNKPIYEILRLVKDTNVVADDGIKELYINLKAKVKDAKLKSLFKIMTTVKEIDNKIFPILSKKKEEVNKLYIGGENNMSGLSLEMYRDGLKAGRTEGRAEGRVEGIAEGIAKGKLEGMQQGKLEAFINIYKKGLLKANEASELLGMTENEFLKLVN